MTNKSTVLIVDDEPANIQVLANCLKDQYLVKVSTSGEQCLALAADDQKPDLILLDIEMPEMDGYEICRQLKNNPGTAGIPVIFVTGKGDENAEELGLLLGAVDYITKPIRPAIVAARVSTHVELKQQRDQLEKLAMKDQLTDVYNRHYLLEVANHKVARAMRHKHPLSLLMIDVDHFKNVNDSYGHPKGDEILKAVSQLLIEQTRKEDVVARFGGEEFVILMDHCGQPEVGEKAENLRQLVESLNPGGINVTVSIGLAELNPGEESFSGLLKRADTAVYAAKDQGRNQVVAV